MQLEQAARQSDDRRQRHGAGSVARYLTVGILYVLAYLALDRLSFIHAWSIFGFTLWNPPPALSLALILLRGPAYIPFIVAASLSAEFIVRNALLGPAPAVMSAAILAVGYGCLGVLLRRAGPIDLPRGSLRELGVLLFLVPFGVLVIGAVFVGTFALLGLILPADYVRAVSSFWIGDVTGIIAVLPALLIVLDHRAAWRQRLRGAAIDFLAFAAALFAAIWLMFIAGFVNELQYFYLLFIPIIWIAIRRGIAGAALGVFIVQASVVLIVLVRPYPPDTFLSFQAFFLIIGTTGLLLGAIVTARYQAELRLREQQSEIDRVARMTSIGVMGSALAHQISQPLASIASYAHAAELLLKSDTPHKVRTVLAEIASEADRAGQVLRRLRDFIAEGKIDKRQTDIATIVEKVATLVRRQHTLSRVSLLVHSHGLPTAMVDPVQIEQVFLNIMHNAVEAALSSQAAGIVTVTLRADDKDIEIAVDDNGPGIDIDVADRLCEPFVTSKSYGMGLGLAICHAILKAHSGSISHRGLTPTGTRCTVRIPRE